MSKGGSAARADVLGGEGWVIFGLWIVVESLRMDSFTSMGANIYTMPGFVSGMIGCVIIAQDLMHSVRGWRASRSLQHSSATSADTPEPLINRRIALALPPTRVYSGALLGSLQPQ